MFTDDTDFRFDIHVISKNKILAISANCCTVRIVYLFYPYYPVLGPGNVLQVLRVAFREPLSTEY